MAYPNTQDPLKYSGSFSTDIPVHFIQTFANYVIHEAQQKQSKLRPLFESVPVRGEYMNFELTGTTTLDEVTTRYDDTSYEEHDESRRQIGLTKYSKAFLFEEFDPNQLVVNPQNEYVKKLAMAAGRRWDDTIIAAIYGTVRTGHAGATSVAWSPSTNSDCKQIDAGDNLMSLDNLKEGAVYLDEAEFMDPDEPRYCITTPRNIANLLSDEKLTSADYATVKALVQGELDTFYGFKFIKTNRLLSNDDGQKRCILCTRSALVVGTAGDMTVKITQDVPTKNHNTQIWGRLVHGAMRIQEKGVVELLTAAESGTFSLS